MATSILYILAGLALLIVGGDWLVRGASGIALRLGLSPLIIGLTIVGFGTSTPELVTSVRAGMTGASGIAYGNIVGSNITNILLIIGLSAIITDLKIEARALRRDGLVMLAAACAFCGIAVFAAMNRPVGAVFVGVLILYIGFAISQEKQPLTASDDGNAAKPSGRMGWDLPVLFLGLAGVMAGGYALVEGAVSLAGSLGISESIIGLTIVAVGTSAPELATSIIAARRGNVDVAVGNVIGSNIYNILGIGGVTAILAPGTVPETITLFDSPVMIAASFLLMIFAFTGLKIRRWEGCTLVLLYAAYTSYLWMH